MNESKIQILVVSYVRTYLPDPFIIYAIPNGGKRELLTAVKLKSEGVLAGMPDLHIPIPCQGYHSLYVEMKSANGHLSNAQKDMHKRLRAWGNLVLVCYSVEEAVCAIVDYYNPQKLEMVLKMFHQQKQNSSS